MKVLRVNINGEWMGALFERGEFQECLDTRLNWMAGMTTPEIAQILRLRKAQYHWIDLDTDVKRAQLAT